MHEHFGLGLHRKHIDKVDQDSRGTSQHVQKRTRRQRSPDEEGFVCVCLLLAKVHWVRGWRHLRSDHVALRLRAGKGARCATKHHVQACQLLSFLSLRLCDTLRTGRTAMNAPDLHYVQHKH
jgi:hypothetical protein